MTDVNLPFMATICILIWGGFLVCLWENLKRGREHRRR